VIVTSNWVPPAGTVGWLAAAGVEMSLRRVPETGKSAHIE
jgi:hypothetical protein